MKRLFALLALGLIAPAMFVGCGEEPAKTDAPKVDAPKVDAPKADAPKS